MKILFIASRKFDYGQDLLYRGLVELLGQENVRPIPFNSTYFFGHKKYPKNLGKSEDASFWRYLQARSIGPKNCDAVVVGAAKPDAFEFYKRILLEIPSSTPTVFVDGGDREEIGGDLFRLNAKSIWDSVNATRPFDFIFKREMLIDRDYAANIFPLPFSMAPSALQTKPFPEPDKDVSFWAVESDPIRTKALDLLTGQFDCDENGTGRNKKFSTYKYKGQRYHQELAKCKIVISLRGGGWDTLRYWEVPALGPLMVTHRLGIRIPNDFEDGVHVARCKDDLSDLLEICDHYLMNDVDRKKMAQAAHEHLLANHTPLQRAKSVVQVVLGVFS